MGCTAGRADTRACCGRDASGDASVGAAALGRGHERTKQQGAGCCSATKGRPPGLGGGFHSPKWEDMTRLSDVPPLRVLILLVGSRGDVQPFVAFAQGLAAYGHKVCIASHKESYKFATDLCEKEGIELYDVGGDPAVLMKFAVEHPSLITVNLKDIADSQNELREIYHGCYDACVDFRPDVLVSNPPTHVHVHLAEYFQVPLQIHFTMPWSPTDRYTHPMSPVGVFGNRQSFHIVEEMQWLGCSSLINELRTQIMDPPMEWKNDGAELTHRTDIPHLYCASEALMPQPDDWPSHIAVVGFWFASALASNFGRVVATAGGAAAARAALSANAGAKGGVALASPVPPWLAKAAAARRMKADGMLVRRVGGEEVASRADIDRVIAAAGDKSLEIEVAHPDWDQKLADFLDTSPPSPSVSVRTDKSGRSSPGASRRRPIYIGFGSVTCKDPGGLSRAVWDAIAEVQQRVPGVRFVVQPGWAKLGDGLPVPDGVFIAGRCPHDWLFPKCAGVVHHGGAGTTATGLQCDCPTLVVPFFGDQPFWGKQCAAQGVGPEPVPYRRNTGSLVRPLADALVRMSDGESAESMRKCAKKVGKQLREEDGVVRGVEVFHNFLDTSVGLTGPSKERRGHRGSIGAVTWENQVLRRQKWVPSDDTTAAWTDRTGLMYLPKEGFEDIDRTDDGEGSWVWAGDWKVDTGPADNPYEWCGDDGWQYAAHWHKQTDWKGWHQEQRAGDWVRRRRWMRIREKFRDPAPAVPQTGLSGKAQEAVTGLSASAQETVTSPGSSPPSHKAAQVRPKRSTFVRVTGPTGSNDSRQPPRQPSLLSNQGVHQRTKSHASGALSGPLLRQSTFARWQKDHPEAAQKKAPTEQSAGNLIRDEMLVRCCTHGTPHLAKAIVDSTKLDDQQPLDTLGGEEAPQVEALQRYASQPGRQASFTGRGVDGLRDDTEPAASPLGTSGGAASPTTFNITSAEMLATQTVPAHNQSNAYASLNNMTLANMTLGEQFNSTFGHGVNMNPEWAGTQNTSIVGPLGAVTPTRNISFPAKAFGGTFAGSSANDSFQPGVTRQLTARQEDALFIVGMAGGGRWEAFDEQAPVDVYLGAAGAAAAPAADAEPCGTLPAGAPIPVAEVCAGLFGNDRLWGRVADGTPRGGDGRKNSQWLLLRGPGARPLQMRKAGGTGTPRPTPGGPRAGRQYSGVISIASTVGATTAPDAGQSPDTPLGSTGRDVAPPAAVKRGAAPSGSSDAPPGPGSFGSSAPLGGTGRSNPDSAGADVKREASTNTTASKARNTVGDGAHWPPKFDVPQVVSWQAQTDRTGDGTTGLTDGSISTHPNPVTAQSQHPSSGMSEEAAAAVTGPKRPSPGVDSGIAGARYDPRSDPHADVSRSRNREVGPRARLSPPSPDTAKGEKARQRSVKNTGDHTVSTTLSA